MAFRLCLLLGVEHPDMLAMSSRQFADWIAYAEVEPFGEDRADLRMGILASVMAAPHSKSRPRPIDFMPFPKLRKKQTAEEQATILRDILGR